MKSEVNFEFVSNLALHFDKMFFHKLIEEIRVMPLIYLRNLFIYLFIFYRNVYLLKKNHFLETFKGSLTEGNV